jgi:hypothetical protein
MTESCKINFMIKLGNFQTITLGKISNTSNKPQTLR